MGVLAAAHLIFHHEDRDQVDDFVRRFGYLFAAVGQQGVTAGDDFVALPSDEAIVSAIRRRYLDGVSIAIVLVGASTWSRRFVDWEIAACMGDEERESIALVACLLESAPLELPPRLRSAEAPVVDGFADEPAVVAPRLCDAVVAAFTAPPVRSLRRLPLQRADVRPSSQEDGCGHR